MASLVYGNVGRKRLPLVFLPLKLYKMMYFAFVLFTCVYLMFAVNRLMDDVLPTTAMFFLTIAFGVGGMVHVVRDYLSAREELGTQLSTFAVENASCYSEDDRRVVERSLRLWFGDLDAFNMLVRSQVHDHVIQAIGSPWHPYI